MNLETEFPKAYIASEHESEVYSAWESSGAFRPSSAGEPWSLVAPPPNANGNLHMGHALEVAIMDILTRYNRMQGKRALWVPGADHAGFETQVVFEKKLEKEGRSRFQMTQEQFYKEALAFTLENKVNMENQLRMLGASCDWSAERFTLDPEVVQRVYQNFRQMYADGLIYRGERIVNYSVKYQTAYSDLEVMHEDRVDPLYYVKYGPLVVATVRPETQFGDVAVAVNPADERYAQWVGKEIEVTLATGEVRKMPVIADDFVKPEFGTGAVKVTPAHDPNDFEMAQRHNLPLKSVIDLRGRLTDECGEFAGMKTAEARKAVAAKLQKLGLIERVDESYRHNVALCYKSLQPIEPLIMPQWYVKVRPLAERAIAALEAKPGEADYINIEPDGYRRILIEWFEGLRDWNISRQIWWGIPIKDAMPENPEVANDPDTFDTWFSSGQWPYAVMEALGEEALRDFFPTDVMQTGRDLTFLWVSRMIMMSLYVHKAVPFKNLYFHGMILDKQGKKMSKSKGNVVSPVELVAKYGADAVRFGLVVGSSAAGDIPLPEEKMVGGRNFANKLWNMARFVLMQLDGRVPSGLPAVESVTEADQLILKQLQAARQEVEAHLEHFRFAQAIQAVHEFAWHQFADVYVEAAKHQKDDSGRVDDQTCAILFHVLESILIMTHPFMPFVTETIWNHLPEREGQLISASWKK
jgi:valyl-tRNA synthetase